MSERFVLCLLLVAASACWGWPTDYAPFTDGARPPKCPLNPCVAIAPEGAEPSFALTGEFAATSNGYPRIRLDWESGVTVSSVNGKTLLPPTSLSGVVMTEVPVFWALLNEDDFFDYIVVTHNSGCGLAFGIFFLTFILSSPGGYSAQTVLCYWPGPEDFLDIQKNGRPVFTHTVFVFGEEGRDGRAHNYWVYNLLRFEGTNIVSANACIPGFPKWIWYTHKPNHKDTLQLTAEQRRRLWRKTWKTNTETWEAVLFPNPEAFAGEQGATSRPSQRSTGPRP
jgi:hypothetical protein